MENEGVWLPILEYANYRKISISTVRRMIKAERVPTRLDDGKYFIFVAQDRFDKKKQLQESIYQKIDELTSENERLKQMLRQKEEELLEQRMLVKVYEEKEIPPLPLEYH